MVVKKNPFFPLRTMVEAFDDGVQKCVLLQEGNRVKAISHEGLIHPMITVRPFLMKIQKRGLDK